jgi:hypothetical protein
MAHLKAIQAQLTVTLAAGAGRYSRSEIIRRNGTRVPGLTEIQGRILLLPEE